MQLKIMLSAPFLLLGRTLKLTRLYRRDVAALKGKTTKNPSKMFNPNEVRDILSHIVKNYYEVSLYIDIMYVNGIMVLVGWGRISSCHWMVVYDNNDSIIFVVTENVNLANAQNEVY